MVRAKEVPTRTIPVAPPTIVPCTKSVSTIGGFSRRVIETDFVQGTIVGGATGVVRVGSSFARAIQTGYLRAYALMLLLGLAALTLYFLINSS